MDEIDLGALSTSDLSSSAASLNRIEPVLQEAVHNSSGSHIAGADASSIREVDFSNLIGRWLYTCMIYCGVPPISCLRVAIAYAVSDRHLSISLYRITMTIVLVLGIPATLLSVLGNLNLPAGIIGIASIVCTLFLFWAKELRDHDKNWAPWLFERDFSGVLLAATCLNLIVIRRVLIECLLMLLGQMSGGSRSPNGFFSIGELIFSLGGSYATTVLVTGRSARWLRRLPWMLCFLLESALLFSQTLMGLLPFIGYALWKGASFSHSLQGWWRDLRLDAMVLHFCFLLHTIFGVKLAQHCSKMG